MWSDSNNVRSPVGWLLAQGLIEARDLVESGLEVFDASRRHANVRIIVRNGPAFFLKRAVDAERREALLREGALYAEVFARRTPRPRDSLRVARLVGRDQEGTLVLELIRDCHTMREVFSRARRRSSEIATIVGGALAELHAIPVEGPLASPMPAPWPLSFHEPRLAAVWEYTGASRTLLTVVQSSSVLGEGLTRARALWRPEALSHNDFRWDNALIAKRTGRYESAVWIVDFEMSGWGDPAWDLAAFFSDALTHWVSSLPLLDDLELEASIRLATYPLESLQAIVRAFWSGYSTTMEQESSRRLWRAVLLLGPRLVQAAFERAQQSRSLTKTSVALVQMAEHVLARPDEAADVLLGLPFS